MMIAHWQHMCQARSGFRSGSESCLVVFDHNHHMCKASWVDINLRYVDPPSLNDRTRFLSEASSNSWCMPSNQIRLANMTQPRRLISIEKRKAISLYFSVCSDRRKADGSFLHVVLCQKLLLLPLREAPGQSELIRLWRDRDWRDQVPHKHVAIFSQSRQ